MPRNLDSGAKIGSATCLVTLVAIWPQKCKHFFSATMSLAGQVGHTSYPSRISVPSRGFCFLGKHDLEKSCPSRISVPSRGSCFLGKHILKTVVRLGSAFLAGAFVFLRKTRPENRCPSRISVPSRGSCFLGKHKLSVSDQRS